MRILSLVGLFILFATPSFAGDMYLMCETSDGEGWDNLIVKGRTGVVIDKTVKHEQHKVVVTVERSKGKNQYEVLDINMSNGGFTRRKVQTSAYSESVQVDRNTECRIVD